MVRNTRLKILYFPIEKIESFGVPEVIKVSWDSTNVFSLLQEIIPEKKAYFAECTEKNITLSLLPDAPFMPDPLVQAEFLFGNFKKALEDLLENDLFREIEVLGLPPGRHFEAPGLAFRNTSIYGKTETALLNLMEFSRLYESITRRQFEDRRMVSLWEDPSRVWAACVPAGMELKEFIPKLTGLKEEELEKRKIHHPMTGQIFSPSDKVSGRTGNLCISQDHWELQSASAFFFAFPQFNRQLKWMQTETPNENSSNQGPCSNCLSCVKICPADIYPNLLYHYLVADQEDEAEKFKVRACIGCGFCSTVCPSKIPMAAGILNHISKEIPSNETA